VSPPPRLRVVDDDGHEPAADAIGIRPGVSHERGGESRALDVAGIAARQASEQVVQRQRSRLPPEQCVHDHALQGVVGEVEEHRQRRVVLVGGPERLARGTQLVPVPFQALDSERPIVGARGQQSRKRSREQLRIAGEGEAGALGGPPGDLYVVLRVAEHAFFKRDGTHLFCEVPVSVPQAALGSTLEVPTLDGGKTRVTVPEGTQSGTVLRVKGQGVPQLGGRGRGDLHVLVRVAVPKHLTSEQRKLFEQLAKILPLPDSKDQDKSLLERMKDLLG